MTVEYIQKDDDPYLSVVIPTLPRNDTVDLEDALLNQTYDGAYEVLLIRDAGLTPLKPGTGELKKRMERLSAILTTIASQPKIGSVKLAPILNIIKILYCWKDVSPAGYLTTVGVCIRLLISRIDVMLRSMLAGFLKILLDGVKIQHSDGK